MLEPGSITVEHSIIDLVFTKTGCRKSLVRYVGVKASCPLCRKAYSPPAIRQLAGRVLGHSFRAWAVYQHVTLRLPYTAKLMCRLLMIEGHEVVVASCVAEGLQAARDRRPDLLISDLGLPDGSGLDLMRELVARGERVPAIALSGYGTPADVEKSRAAGFGEHLVKPLQSVEVLSAAIARLGVCGRQEDASA